MRCEQSVNGLLGSQVSRGGESGRTYGIAFVAEIFQKCLAVTFEMLRPEKVKSRGSDLPISGLRRQGQGRLDGL